MLLLLMSLFLFSGVVVLLVGTMMLNPPLLVSLLFGAGFFWLWGEFQRKETAKQNARARYAYSSRGTSSTSWRTQSFSYRKDEDRTELNIPSIGFLYRKEKEK